MKKVTINICKVLIGLVSLMLLFTWSRWFFEPEAMYELYEVSAETITGINMLKANMSSGVLAIAVLGLLYLIKGRMWLLPSMVAVACMLITRIGFMLIEGSAPQVLTGIAMEAFTLILWIVLYRLDTSNNTNKVL